MEKFCLYCGEKLDTTTRDNRVKFCNSSCAAKYNNHKRKHTDETKQKISNKLKNKKKEDGPMMKLVDVHRSKRCEVTPRESSSLSRATKQKQPRRYTIEDVEREIKNVDSYTKLCHKLNISERGNNIRTLKTIVMENNFDVSHFKYGKKYDTLIIENIESCKSYAELCRKIGVRDCGSSLTRIIEIVKELRLDTSHFTGRLWSKGKTSAEEGRLFSKDVNEYLTDESTISSFKLKNLLFKYGIKREVCENCSNSMWMGKQIPLQLHHLNGNRRDNRLENLMILCPNCHAQTDNYCSKNRLYEK